MSTLKKKVIRSIISGIKFVCFGGMLVTGAFLLWYFNIFEPRENISCKNYFETSSFVENIENELMSVSKAVLNLKKYKDKEFDTDKKIISVMKYGENDLKPLTYKDIEQICQNKDVDSKELEKWEDNISLKSKEYITIEKEQFIDMIEEKAVTNYDSQKDTYINDEFGKNAYVFSIKKEEKNKDNKKDNNDKKDEYWIYSKKDDIFYSNSNGWFRLPSVLYFEKDKVKKEGKKEISIYDMAKTEFYSIPQVFSCFAADYIEYKEAKKFLDENRSILYYIKDKDGEYKSDDISSKEDIKKQEFYVEFDLKDVIASANYETDVTKNQLKTFARLFKTEWGKNTTLYFGLKSDYSDLGVVSKQASWFNEYHMLQKKLIVLFCICLVAWFVILYYLVVTADDRTRCSRTITSLVDVVYSDVATLIVILFPIGMILMGAYIKGKYDNIIQAIPIITMALFFIVTYTLSSLFFFSVVRRTKAKCYFDETLILQVIRKTKILVKNVKKTGSKVVLYIIAMVCYVILNAFILCETTSISYENKYKNAIPVSVLEEYEDAKDTELYREYSQHKMDYKSILIKYTKMSLLIIMWICMNIFFIYYVAKKKVEYIMIRDVVQKMALEDDKEQISSKEMSETGKEIVDNLNKMKKKNK